MVHVLLGCLRPYQLAELLGHLVLYYASCAFFFLSSMMLPDIDRNQHSFTVVHVNMHLLFAELSVLAVSVGISAAAYVCIYYHPTAKATVPGAPITRQAVTVIRGPRDGRRVVVVAGRGAPVVLKAGAEEVRLAHSARTARRAKKAGAANAAAQRRRGRRGGVVGLNFWRDGDGVGRAGRARLVSTVVLERPLPTRLALRIVGARVPEVAHALGTDSAGNGADRVCVTLCTGGWLEKVGATCLTRPAVWSATPGVALAQRESRRALRAERLRGVARTRPAGRGLNVGLVCVVRACIARCSAEACVAETLVFSAAPGSERAFAPHGTHAALSAVAL